MDADATAPATRVVEDAVTALYRELLRREPDPQGLADHAERWRTSGPAAVLRAFLNSAEFNKQFRNAVPPSIALNFGPPMAVEATVPEADLAAIWAHVAQVWSGLGETDPLWSVMTDERFRNDAKPSRALVQEFHDSGESDLTYCLAFLARAGLDTAAFRTVAEYGCGVGRVTRFLAGRFGRVRAFDISAPHLAAARAYLAGNDLANVDFVHVRTRDDLAALQGVDLFFSLIVLQHNPPPVILDILDRAFAGLNPGGVAFFQVPTYNAAYAFTLERYWHDTATRNEIEMHFVPQSAILEVAARHGVQLIETRQDHCVGTYDRWISNTFLMRKA